MPAAPVPAVRSGPGRARSRATSTAGTGVKSRSGARWNPSRAYRRWAVVIQGVECSTRPAAPLAPGPVDAGPDQRLAHPAALRGRCHGEHPEAGGVLVVPLGVLVVGAGHIGDCAVDAALGVHGHEYHGYLGPVRGIPEIGLVVGLGVIARQRPVGGEHQLADSVILARTDRAYPHVQHHRRGGRGVVWPVCQARQAGPQSGRGRRWPAPSGPARAGRRRSGRLPVGPAAARFGSRRLRLRPRACLRAPVAPPGARAGPAASRHRSGPQFLANCRRSSRLSPGNRSARQVPGRRQRSRRSLPWRGGQLGSGR